jgi:FixJ family two-component response regulator
VPETNRVVFVVDDEAVIAETLAIILNQAGFQAIAFDHPEKAIAALAELIPALLISDVMMPGMKSSEFEGPQPNIRPPQHTFRVHLIKWTPRANLYSPNLLR